MGRTLVTLIVDNAAPSCVVDCRMLPTCCDDVTVRRRPDATPVLTRLRMLLSDVQIVDSAPLTPWRDVELHDPRWPLPPRPTTVTLCDPVMATLVAVLLLNDTPSNVMLATRVPSPVFAVVTIALPTCTPDPALTVMPVLDSHSVVADRVPPIDARAVINNVPIPDATTVTLVPEVVARLLRILELTPGPSSVTADVRVPTCTAAVVVIRRPTAVPALLRSHSALLDCHTVDSTLLPPRPARDVQSFAPSCVPTTVTLQLPVDCPLERPVELGTGPMCVQCTVRLPTCPVAVSDNAR